MQVWEQDARGEPGPTFIELLRADPQVTNRLSETHLKDLFSLDRHLAHLDEAYRRVGLE